MLQRDVTILDKLLLEAIAVFLQRRVSRLPLIRSRVSPTVGHEQGGNVDEQVVWQLFGKMRHLMHTVDSDDSSTKVY